MSTPVYVIRHGLAGIRDLWPGPDELRPLTEEGWLQAEAIAERDARMPFVRLLSSPYLRCVETFEPLGSKIGLPVERRPELGEGMPPAYVEKIAQEVGEEGPAAICVHGDQLHGLFDDLRTRGIPLPDIDHPDLGKGSTLILDVGDGVVRSVTYLPPPTLADRVVRPRAAP